MEYVDEDLLEDTDKPRERSRGHEGCASSWAGSGCLRREDAASVTARWRLGFRGREKFSTNMLPDTSDSLLSERAELARLMGELRSLRLLSSEEPRAQDKRSGVGGCGCEYGTKGCEERPANLEAVEDEDVAREDDLGGPAEDTGDVGRGTVGKRGVAEAESSPGLGEICSYR